MRWTAAQEKSLSRDFPLPNAVEVTSTEVTHTYLQFLWLPEVCVLRCFLSAAEIANLVSELEHAVFGTLRGWFYIPYICIAFSRFFNS